MSENKNFKKEDDSYSSKKAEESEEQNERGHNSASAQEDVDVVDNDDYLSSFNYFVFYNSIKPVDPRLPKPLYRPNNNYLKVFFLNRKLSNLLLIKNYL